MLRLFVGLALPDGVIARLSTMCAGLPGADWVAPANMHLTLRFIGEVEETTAEEIDGLLARVEAEAFSLELDGVGTFGDGAKVHSIWAAVKPSAALSHLQAKIESAVVRAGLPPEGRKFTPHVTLARLNRPHPARLEAFIAGNSLFQAGPFQIPGFTLFESLLGKGGAVYTPLVDYDSFVPDT